MVCVQNVIYIYIYIQMIWQKKITRDSFLFELTQPRNVQREHCEEQHKLSIQLTKAHGSVPDQGHKQ